jgi:hypothetical protein
MSFITDHKYIGVASEGDVIPDIVKAGMALSDSGISYGDADSDSNWKNPTKYAWDDFDWIRYACEKADDEDQAVNYLTKYLVDEMHASGVSENLFIVGPNKGFVVEADAYRYDIKEINDGIVVMSNYPKELWKTQVFKKLPISRSFDTSVEKNVRKMEVVRLKSLFGIRIIEIGDEFISIKTIPLIYNILTKNIGVKTIIREGERKTVGDFSIELIDIDNNKALISVCNVFKAWEEKMLDYIEPRYGYINVRDMINWSRLHRDDLDGLRPMCQEIFDYESVVIYKIPRNDFKEISSGWFSSNHACSSIYVPFHICNTDIYDPYETGEAAQLSLDLLKVYGSGYLSDYFWKTEEVFLNEINYIEDFLEIYWKQNIDTSDFMTTIDMSMQRQAYFTEELWMELSKISDNKQIIDIIAEIWNKNYTNSLINIENAVSLLDDIPRSINLRTKIIEITLDICKSRINALEKIGKQIELVEEEYKIGKDLIGQGKYKNGFDYLINVFNDCNKLYIGQSLNGIKTDENDETNYVQFIFIVVFTILILIILIVIIKNKKN